MTWNLPELTKESLADVAARFDCDLFTAAVLIRRGITTPEQVKFILDPDFRNLHNPFLFREMTEAVDRVIEAAEEGEKVLVFGDRDVDGITSTVLLCSALRKLGIDIEWRVPLGDDNYGITEDLIRDFASRDGTLIITVDCGISAVREVDVANSLGIDTIIIDHHNPQDAVPEALAILDPKLEDSGYPFAGLCGAALATKFLWALDFAGTEFYKQRFTLLNARPGNDSIVFEIIKLENLVEVDRLVETIIPGMIRPEDSRIVDFLMNEAILVYDAPAQLKLLRQVFGQNVEIGLNDLAPEIAKVFPGIRGQSLVRLLETSKLTKFSSRRPLEVEAFAQLFTAFTLARSPAVQEGLARNLDLCAFGLVADMMPMRDENRILVKRGLVALAETKRPGLRELLSVVKLLGKPLTAQDLGWKLGPIINSTGRMGRPDLAVKLLLVESPDDPSLAELVAEVIKMNDERKEQGAQAWARVRPLAQSSKDKYGNRFVIVKDGSVHRGITGVLAGRLSKEMNVPSLVLALVDGRAVGSIRSVRGFSATGFLAGFSDLFDSWGGHDAAAGFSLAAEKVPDFESRVPAVLEGLTMENEVEEIVQVDLRVPHANMDPGIEELENLFQPAGQEFGRLVFQVDGALVEELQFLGKAEEHLKLGLRIGKNRWPALIWNTSNTLPNGARLEKGSQIDFVFHLEKNFWGQNQTLQLQVIDLKLSDNR